MDILHPDYCQCASCDMDYLHADECTCTDCHYVAMQAWAHSIILPTD